ncbi:MAG: hypothetical protein SF187_00435 [Deltaproteobacteria bacterium]|nr:hypothetical protein [Deltaproteobacteria bacterium]
MAKISRIALVSVISTLPVSPVVAQEAGAPTPTAEAAAAPPPAAYGQQFGLSMRGRYVTVPSWFLGLFSKENSPLHTAGFLIEGFRRKDNFDIAVGLGYQNMSPPDGNWLGRGKDPAADTDFVQVKGMSLISLDVNFTWNAWVNEYLGFYYGAGLGLGILTGKVLRTSAANCNSSNVGDETQCKPKVCQGTTCTEAELAASEGGRDNGPDNPHRFKEGSIPGALPIVNLMAGVNLRFPEAPGLELRLLEGGFHNAFFLGSSVAYLF